MYCDLLTIGTWEHPSPHKTCWRFKWMVPKQAQFLRTWIRYVYQKSFGEFWISWPVGLIASRFGAKFQILSRNWACKNQMRSNLLRTIKCSYPCSWTLMNIFCSTKDLAFSTKLNSFFDSAQKIGHPILANLPTYYVPFLSYYPRPTYLPKFGMSLMDVP